MSSRSSSSSDLASWQSARFTLFLRVHSADKLQLSTSLSSYCKLYLGETPVVSSSLANILIKDQPAQDGQPEHRTFLTKVCTSKSKLTALWNEKFEIPVDDPKKQILSIRVKSQHQLISPAIGACAIQLKQLRAGQTVDQSFPLFKGSTQVGSIRLQLMLRENYAEDKIPMARVVEDAGVAKKKTVKKIVKKKVDSDEEEEEEGTRRPRDSLLALERERRRLEEEEEDRRRREREREQQLAMEKKRIEERMEQLRREEEERKRLKAEEEERRRIAAEKLAAEQEEQRLRRQWEQQEEEQARRDGYIVQTTPYDNQVEADAADATKKKEKKHKQSLQASTRRSTLSLRDMLDMVVQDALPSDSDDDSDSEELDTEDEKELIRQIAKLKLQMKKKKKEARARLHQDGDKSKVKVVYVYEDEEAERRHKAKSFNQDLYARSPVGKGGKEKHSKSYGDVIDRNSSGAIKSLVPGEFDKRKEAKEDKKKNKEEKKNKDKNKNNKNNNQNQNDTLTLGQMVQAATSVATLAVGMDDGEITGEVIPDAVDALQNLVPIGRFFGRKLHEATAKVAQMNEKETPSYYF